MKYLSCILVIFFHLSSKGQFGIYSDNTDQQFFSKAVPVWIDSRNVKKTESDQSYTLTTSGRHDSRQVEKNLTASFRACFNLEQTTNVVLKLAASTNYRAFVNGQFLSHGPCVAGHGYYRVDEYNVSDYLKTGENIIAIEVAGYNVYSYYLLNQTSFLQAEITQNGKVIASTNTNGNQVFEACMLDQRVKNVPLYSFQRPYLESYVLTPDYQSWMTQKMDKNFYSLKLEQTSHKNLIVRRVKKPDYSIRKYTASLGDSIYQFQCNTTGFIGVHVKVNASSKLTFSWDEILNDQKDVNPRRLNCESFLYYQLAPGEYDLESFEPYTLQYLKVKVEEGDCQVSNPYIRQYANSDVGKSTFESSSEKLNRIYNAAVETYRQNALDIFTDCPQRERAGWLCDSYFTGRVAFSLSGNTLIETNFLENFLMPEHFDFLPEGMLPMCYPCDHPNANYIPNWAMWYVLELEEYFKRSGDHQMVIASKKRVLDLLKFFSKYENEDGLLENLEKWIFIEWSKANSFVQDVNYPTNMLYASMLETAGRLYAMPELIEKASRLRDAIRAQAFDGTFFIDNAIRKDGKLVPQKDNRTETCQYYAFFFGTASPKLYPKLWQILVNDFGPKRKDTKAYPEIYPSNAFIGNYLRLEILSRYGYVKQLLNESVDNFSYMAELSGTLWENIHPRASLNHGFASHIAHVFYRDLLGFKEVDIVNRKVFIEFNDTDIKSCKGTVPAENDVLGLQWEKKGNKLIYNYSIPSGYEVFIKNNTSMKLEKY